MKKIWVLYIKSSELELTYAFTDEAEARRNMVSWGKYVTIHEFEIKI